MTESPNGWMERLPFAEYAEDGWHTTRYEWATTYVAGKSVLDIACGNGYGTWYLATHGAKTVLGIDADLAVVEQCKLACKDEHGRVASFAIGDALLLPLADRTIDVIVSFETLEHISDYERCLIEFTRVLTDDGIVVLSTPNALVTQPVDGVPCNPFHVHEFEPREMQSLLVQYFQDVDLLGQRLRSTVSSQGIEKNRTLLHRLIALFPLKWRLAFPRLLPHRLGKVLVSQATGGYYDVKSEEIEFTPEKLDRAPVLMAVCRRVKPSPTQSKADPARTS